MTVSTAISISPRGAVGPLAGEERAPSSAAGRRRRRGRRRRCRAGRATSTMAAWAKCCSTQAWNAVPRRAASAGGLRHRPAQRQGEPARVLGQRHDGGGGQVARHAGPSTSPRAAAGGAPPAAGRARSSTEVSRPPRIGGPLLRRVARRTRAGRGAVARSSPAARASAAARIGQRRSTAAGRAAADRPVARSWPGRPVGVGRVGHGRDRHWPRPSGGRSAGRVLDLGEEAGGDLGRLAVGPDRRRQQHRVRARVKAT